MSNGFIPPDVKVEVKEKSSYPEIEAMRDRTFEEKLAETTEKINAPAPVVSTPKISPKGSFEGYNFWVYVSKNSNTLKTLGTAAISLGTALWTGFGIGIPPEIAVSVSALAGALFHAIISAIQFRYSEVKLE